MPRKYSRVQEYEKEIFEMRDQGMTWRKVGEKLGFSKSQMKQFNTRHNRKQRKLAAGIPSKPKGRPKKMALDPTSTAYWYNPIGEIKIVSSQTVIWLCRFPKHSNIEILTGAESGKIACLVSIQELLTM